VVLGAPSPHGDQMIRCVIEANAPCTPEEILEHCRVKITVYKIPRLIESAETLPKSPTGKILRHEL